MGFDLKLPDTNIFILQIYQYYLNMYLYCDVYMFIVIIIFIIPNLFQIFKYIQNRLRDIQNDNLY